MEQPIMYQQQELINYFNLQPSEVKGRCNTATEFHKRYLYTKVYSTLKFTIPDNWDMNFFRFWLFRYGSIAVIYTNEFGWVAQPYSVDELQLYYNPRKITVYNQFIKKPKTGIIGINAGIIRIMDDYFGLDDIVTKYAEMLAQIDRSINVNLMNCNITAFFEADSKKQADEVKEAYGNATSGKPLVVVNKEVMNGKQITTLLPNVGNNYIVDKLLTARRCIINAFLTEIGIRNANYEKKERLNSAEVEENNDETKAIITVIYENVKKCMETINAFSGLHLDVELRYEYTKREEAEEWQE